MGFYEEISKYYDFIFPAGLEQINFISKTAGDSPKQLLDIACGTGGYSLELAKLGYTVTGVDIDETMVKEAIIKGNAAGIQMRVLQSDMLSLTSKLSGTYDTIFCIGNSIVHLGGLEDIKTFLAGVKALIKSGGNVVFQIINFDRIFEKGITELPKLEDKSIGLCFERMYEVEKDSDKILFKTILKVKDEKIENTIPLFPLRSRDFLELIAKAGFKKTETYGDFIGSPYNKTESYLLVLRVS